MSTTNSAVKHTHVRFGSERVVLFGSERDPEVAQRKKKLQRQGRDVIVQARPGFDTGLGQCGQFLCHCNGNCKAQYEQTI